MMWSFIQESEWWCICTSKNGDPECEEELYVKGKTAVWSRGVDGSQVVLCCYTCETPVKHALWCTFHSSASDKPVLENNESTFTDEPKGKCTAAAGPKLDNLIPDL